jgi:hypothetical protein
MAVVASILTAIYHMLKDGTMYNNHFDRRSSDQQKNRLVKRLAELGYAVEIKPLAAQRRENSRHPQPELSRPCRRQYGQLPSHVILPIQR